MAIEYYDAVNGDGLFNILGKIFHAQNTLNTARGTTVPAEILDAVNQYKKKTDADLEMDRAIEGLSNAERSWRNTGATLANQLQRTAQNLLTEVVRADSTIDRSSLTASLEYLIEKMIADAYYVDANTPGSSVVADGGNSATDVSIAVTHYNGDLVTQQNILAETLTITVEGSGANTTLRIQGESPVSNSLSEEWPGGSGVNTTIPIFSPSDSIITNGDFETETIANVPDGWIYAPTTPGATYRITDFTQQTVIISGTPTAGHYNLVFTDPATSNEFATGNLTYNATAAQVQAALRLLPGLSAITVTSTGTSPNLTHTVVFEGVAASVAVLTSLEYFDTGSIAHAITVTGDTGGMFGKALVIESSDLGAEFYLPISPVARTLYALSAHIRAFGATVHNITLSIVDGIGGSVVASQSGAALSTGISGSSAINTHMKLWFAISDTAVAPMYLKLSVTAETEGIIVDDLIVAPTQTLYPGGPTVVAYRGKIAPAVGDQWTIPTTNNGAGALQTMFHRNFNMAGKRLLLPSAGTTLIPDAVIG